MINLIPFFGLVFTIFFLSCEKPKEPTIEEVISYPITFTFNELAFGESQYFVVENQTPIEISASGNFLLFESTISQDITRESLEFPFEEFILLNESEVKLISTNQGTAPQDTTLNYLMIDDMLRVFIDEASQQYFDLEYNQPENQLKFCIFSTLYSHKSFNNEVSYLLEMERCEPLNIPELALKVIDDNSLETGDTIAINHSYFVYD